jgi:hypothetical protein
MTRRQVPAGALRGRGTAHPRNSSSETSRRHRRPRNRRRRPRRRGHHRLGRRDSHAPHPRLLIILGPLNGIRAIPDHEVDSHDALQARLARDYLHPPARSHLHGGQHHNLTDLTDRLRRPKTRVSTKAKKGKHAGREAVRTLSVVVHDFTDPSPRVHGRMTDSACREDRY